uniref:Protein kinase domain-containing protein n=1 Tax=Trichuris muris TaxID=70415 RepID=A0A5S6QYR8_TRIMR
MTTQDETSCQSATTRTAEVQKFLADKWKIKELIATGGFGSVYKAYDTYKGIQVAIKVERRSTQNLLCSEIGWEVHIMSKLKDCPYIPTVFYSRVSHECSFMVMELLGPSLSMIHRNGHQFSTGVVAMIGKQCLQPIKALHQAGFIHRDIKPANFAVGLGTKIRTIHLIDYGMCKRYRSKEGKVLSNRGEVGFRGTVRYASCKAHLSMDLGRGDDMISFFYMLYELINNQLPWSYESDIKYILQLKLACRLDTMASKMGPHMKILAKHVSTLDFTSEPNYDLIVEQLTSTMTEYSVTEQTPFGWEDWLSDESRQSPANSNGSANQ